MSIKIISFLNQTEGSLKHKIIRSGFWVVISNTFVRILEFIRSIFLARLLSPEIFGLWGIVNFIRQGIEIFTQTGFGAALIHRQEKVREAADVAWTLNIGRGFILSILCFLAAPFVAQFYNRPILEILLKIVSLSFIIKGFRNINVILLQKELDFKKIAILEQITAFLGIIITIILAYILRNVWALVWGTMAFFTLDCILSYIIQPLKPKFYFEEKLTKEIFRYGIFITGSGIVIFLTTELDNALVGKVLGMEALGYYVLAYTLANLPATQITHVVSRVMFPAYSQVQNDLEKLKTLYLKTLKLVATFAVPAAAGLFVLAPEIIKVVYGERWAPAIPALRVLCIFGMIRAIGATNGPLFNAIGKPNIIFYTTSLKLASILLIIYPLTKLYGIIGTALAVTIPMVVLTLVNWSILSYQIRLKKILLLKAITPSAICSFIMATLVYLINNYIQYFLTISLCSIINLVLIGIFIYFSILYAINRETFLLLKKFKNV